MEIFKILGISPYLAIIAIGFWSGDDAISKDFKRDISLWLRREKRLPLASSVRAIIIAIFDKTFGIRFISFRFFLSSCVISIFIFTLLYGVVDTFYSIGGSALFFTSTNLITTFLVLSFSNAIADYFSLGETRFILRRIDTDRVGGMILLVFIDIILTALIYLVAFVFVFSTMVLFDVFPYSGFLDAIYRIIISPFSVKPNITEGYEIMGVKFSAMDSATIIPMITTFSTSVWIWSICVGIFIMRFISLSRPAMERIMYVLPVDEKPIRSLGILVALIAIVVSSPFLL